MISTKSVEENNNKFVPQYLKPGINECRIAHMEYVKPDMGSEHIALYMESKPMEALNGEPQKNTFTEYTTEAATKYTLKKLQDIAEAAGTPKEELDKIEAGTWEEYVKLVSPLIVGKWLRFKFGGEEIFSNTTQKVWLKPTIPPFNFVEPITDVVGLKYSEEKDIKRLPKPDVEDMTTTSTDTEDDMPF